jgi:pimeloyl-ACP methyl ester carboxylesterase
VVVLGHSFGGVIGLVLGSGWFGCRVAAVVALGVKVRWTGEDVTRSEALAARPAAWFDSRDEAVARHLRIAGLQDLVEPDDPAALAGVTARDGRWQLAFDPAAFGVGRPDVAGMLAACRAGVRWARGEHDGLVSDDDLRAVAGDHAVLPGLGHSAHVQDPAAVLALLPAPGRAG